jgi:hypothetical protein
MRVHVRDLQRGDVIDASFPQSIDLPEPEVFGIVVGNDRFSKKLNEVQYLSSDRRGAYDPESRTLRKRISFDSWATVVNSGVPFLDDDDEKPASKPKSKPKSKPVSQPKSAPKSKPASPKPASKPVSRPKSPPRRPKLNIADPGALVVMAGIEGDGWLQKQLADEKSLRNSFGFFTNQKAFLLLRSLGPDAAGLTVNQLDPNAGAIAGAAMRQYALLPDGEIVLFGDTATPEKRAQAAAVMMVV